MDGHIEWYADGVGQVRLADGRRVNFRWKEVRRALRNLGLRYPLQVRVHVARRMGHTLGGREQAAEVDLPPLMRRFYDGLVGYVSGSLERVLPVRRDVVGIITNYLLW
eukprot:CAMPEP_0167795630 /NCGR_PEP_ID=MMETSP0111_2-20121227/14555_1 /TAXON_ID=91324 /ORGANISM="Lotharella globosa, Strain CCCM811" /LENGTH=107 /DNA_ID=CAMNT_0007689345 /DNA_START=12 /DNA_END=335 /DNA_ORIENTATION=+